jgi:regulator of sigma E protease
MEQLVMAGQLLLGLGLLVFIHELGHYLAARAFGIRVEKFYIFFDFGGYKLFSTQIGETEYGIGWFPLGGYVKIAGMIDESVDKEFLNTEPQPWEFRSKPAWQRFIVMIGGITMNIILGILIFAFWLKVYKQGYIDIQQVNEGIYAYELAREVGLQTGDKIIEVNGKPLVRGSDLASMKIFFGAVLTVERAGKQVYVDLPDEMFQRFTGAKDRFITLENYSFYVDSVLPESPAAKAGVLKNDKFVAINESSVNSFGAFRESLLDNAAKEVNITALRNNEEVVLKATVAADGTLGFVSSPENKNILPTVKYTVAEAFKFGTKDGFEAIYYNAVGLGKIFTGKVKATESVQSPIGIAKIYGGTWDWARFWYLTGLISFILAFMNLLPIPALDGGHVVFIIIEVIQGKPVSEAILEKAQVVGMVLLLALMAFAFGNDIYKMFT